jgi:hypothetical protein
MVHLVSHASNSKICNQGIMKQPVVINKVNKLTSFLNKKDTKINSPKAKSTMPPATATADPLEHILQLLDPQAAGFVGVPKCSLSPWILNNK